MADISGNGLELSLKASNTFSSGFAITAFADDADPFDIPEITIAETGMGINGDMVSWTKPTPTTITISVIPDSEDDKNLSILLNQNMAGKNKKSAKDVITLTGVYPSGKTVTADNGVLTAGSPSNSVASAGRLKSKTYTFMFQGISGTN